MLTRTTTALLDDLADPANDAIWREFDARYRPLLVGFARRLGLDPEDAADAAQEALGRFVRSYRAGKYERGKGRLSSWIIGIARNCIVDALRTIASRRERPGLSAAGELPGDDQLERIWSAERDRVILQQALRALREESRIDARTIRAFELVAFQQLTPAEAATDLGVTINDVYLAKHRCLTRMRTTIEQITTVYEADE